MLGSAHPACFVCWGVLAAGYCRSTGRRICKQHSLNGNYKAEGTMHRRQFRTVCDSLADDAVLLHDVHGQSLAGEQRQEALAQSLQRQRQEASGLVRHNRPCAGLWGSR